MIEQIKTELRDNLANNHFPKMKRNINEIEKGDLWSKDESINLYVLGNYTVQNLLTYIQVNSVLDNLRPIIGLGEFDIILQEIMTPGSGLDQSRPELIYVSLLLENFVLDFERGQFEVRDVCERLKEIMDSIENHHSALYIFNTFMTPLWNSNGVGSYKNADSMEHKIEEINFWLKAESSKREKLIVIDFLQLERRIGSEKSRNKKYWYIAKSYFTNEFFREVSIEIQKIFRSLKGRTKKCIVLDCDNTLWGGVVGEDGLGGIKLGLDGYPDRVFYDFQKYLLALYQRGILITLCSKNNEEDVLEVLDNHPYMLLKREHIVSHRINWLNKYENINSLAKELNLGHDHFVFVDDSNFECGSVRELLPAVSVFQVPAKIENFVEDFTSLGYFDTLIHSNEDGKRTEMYKQEQARKEAVVSFSNIEEYISSLKIELTIHQVEENEISRVSQLTQKTNQFNLTTKRYSVGDIEKFAKDPNSFVYVLYVKDRFGDFGLTGIAIINMIDGKAHFDSFLMSCRILGKGIETQFVSKCMSDIQKNYSVSRFTAHFHPTKKNDQVSDFWEKRSFLLQESKENGEKIYSRLF